MRNFSIILTALLAIVLTGQIASASPAYSNVRTHSGFSGLFSLAADSEGNVYAVDQGHHQIIELSASGHLVQRFRLPRSCGAIGGLTVAPSGAVYAVSVCTGWIYEFSASGSVLRRFGKPANFDAEYKHNQQTAVGPAGIAADERGHLFVTYAGNGRTGSSIQEFSVSGALVRIMDRSALDFPFGITVDRNDNLFVSVRSGLVKLSSSGKLLGRWGMTGSGLGRILNAGQPALDEQGNVYVTDSGAGIASGVVMKFSPSGKFLGNIVRAGYAPDRTEAPAGLAIDQSGHLYVADDFSNRISQFSLAGKLLAVWQS